jgi:hypothetical protein
MTTRQVLESDHINENLLKKYNKMKEVKYLRLEEVQLPFDELKLNDDELLVVKGGSGSFDSDSGMGCDCGCKCEKGNGCGCKCTKGSGCGCGCGCSDGDGCGCAKPKKEE